MPQIFKIGSYWVFFWANESDPLDPVHVYVCEGAPNANATKIWVTRAGKCYLYHNYSRIPERTRLHPSPTAATLSSTQNAPGFAFFGPNRVRFAIFVLF